MHPGGQIIMYREEGHGVFGEVFEEVVAFTLEGRALARVTGMVGFRAAGYAAQTVSVRAGRNVVGA